MPHNINLKKETKMEDFIDSFALRCGNPLKHEVCEFCAKEDVCSIKEETMSSYKDILDIEGKTNVFINTTIKCKKFLRKTTSGGIKR